MENGFFIIWLFVLVLSFISRALKRNRSAQGIPAAPRPAGSAQASVEQVRKKPVRVSQKMMQSPGAGKSLQERFGAKQTGGDASCETQFGHTHPERTGSALRFGGRPDLEPGYMYLNGVKVLIKEADRLEFLR